MLPLIRYLRIGWTVLFSILCVILLRGWVRSNSWADTLVVKTSRAAITNSPGLVSVQGIVYFGFIGEMYVQSTLPMSHRDVYSCCDERVVLLCDTIGAKPPNPLGITVYAVTVPGSIVAAPYPVLLTAIVLALAAPWFPWSNRFSLRTLLILTTLVAVVLGVIVWAVRK